ncbi:ABC transporter permease subunit [Rhodococcus antarcticus]|uniref:ABC transporter permease subunit n=1 Tax=Rhodococcus antarcticus TaxID=2987751 RepID=A0ABY6P1Q9_9NOCA|nr:ABC transporter permease subunit [Rhodococcus antarcticus]UZJ25580.1 ABC transporter permease subunit [Rhodococcus antarcticus]
MREYLSNAIYRSQLIDLFFQHIYLALLPVLLAVVIALPLGWAAHLNRTATAVMLGVSSVVYTIPSLALFIILPLAIGTAFTSTINIVIALTLYTVALLVRTVVDALESLPGPVLAAATAMGYRPLRRAVTVELPMAIPVLVSGLRVAVVSNVSLVSIGALLGSGGLGLLFIFGLNRSFVAPQIAALVLSALIALVADALLVLAQRLATPWLRVRSAS